MGRNKSVFILKGMTRDTALSKFNAEYAYENMNLRLVSTGENTTGALVSEKGTKPFTTENEGTDVSISISGIPIGQCIIDDKLILFSHDANNIPHDYIYKITIDEDNQLQCNTLAYAELNFSVSNPIECLADYENSSIQKVYWVDGINQPRVINVAGDKTYIWNSDTGKYNNNPDELNFVREAKFDIEKDYNIVTKKLNGGHFPSGIIQYHFTYFNMYGQESAVVYSTQLLYVSPENRGGSPEDAVTNSFEIKIPADSVDTRFEYIRVYSTLRTSLNGVPAAYKVVDIKIDPETNSDYTFVDTGLYNEAIDYTLLLYKGGDDITASTMAQKDGTLFLGNIEIKRPNISDLKIRELYTNDSIQTINVSDNNWMPNKAISLDNTDFGDEITLLHYYCTDYIPIEGIASSEIEYMNCHLPSGVHENVGLCCYDINKNPIKTDFYPFMKVDFYDAYPEYGPTPKINAAYVRFTMYETLKEQFWAKIPITTSFSSLQDYFIKENNREYPNLQINFSKNVRTNPLSVEGEIYPYDSQLNYPSENEPEYEQNQNQTGDPQQIKIKKGIAGFKYGEWYRFGFQAQYKTGQWSDVIWVGDEKCNVFPSVENPNSDTEDSDNPDTSQTITKISYAYINLNNDNGIDEDVIDVLRLNGYTKIRPVVVFPRFEERTVLCQGVVNPTVFNVGNRAENQPFAQSSWFFRPSVPFDFNSVNDTSLTNGYEYNINHFESGKWAEFRHNIGLPEANCLNAELQTSDFLNTVICAPESKTNFISQFKNEFVIDQSIVTMHSPDIEFDDNFLTHDVIKWPKIRIVGYVPITSNSMDIDIQTSTPPMSESADAGLNKIDMFTNNINKMGGRQLLSGGFWYDKPIDDVIISIEGTDIRNNNPFGFVVYPWHRNGSLNDDDGSDSSRPRYAMLKTKRMSTLRYSYKSVYLSNSYDNLKTADIKVFDNRKSRLVKLDTTDDSIKVFGRNKLNYIGDIDAIISLETPYNIYTTQRLMMAGVMIKKYNGDVFAGYQEAQELKNNKEKALKGIAFKSPKTITNDLGSVIEITFNDSSDNYAILSSESIDLEYTDVSIGSITEDFSYSNKQSTDPVSMRYKSMPHIVIELDAKKQNNNYYQQVLPRIYRGSDSYNSSVANYDLQFPFWSNENTNNSGVKQDFIDISLEETNSLLWLAELYRDDTVLGDTRFGGKTKQAFENNLWVVGGEPVELKEYEPNEESPVMEWVYGDTYFQRYDCLKTYPYTTDDQNQIVDILSFLCETRINIDGRYDANRGLESNLHINPENFNKLNSVYSQQNNFFTQRSENPDKLSLSKFKNTVTWTKSKNLGEEIDTWTNLILANTLDFDGDKGRITAIRNFNDTLFVFQEKGIANILYNEKMQISTESGVPIEIANSGRVDGKRYFSTSVGCKNKYSILQTPQEIYFADDYSKGIYIISQGLESLTDKLGFHSWAVNNITGKSWDPENFENIITYYDSINKDVLFVSKDKALAFSESLGAFSSFYSYGDTPYFAFLQDTGIMLHKDNSSNDKKYYLWNYRGGEYNTFFNKIEPYYTEVIVNEHPFVTKIFDTAEFMADCFATDNPDETISDYRENSHLPFDTIYAENEYQKGVYNLSTIGYRVDDKLFRNVVNVSSIEEVNDSTKLYRISNDGDSYWMRIGSQATNVTDKVRSISVNNPSHLKQKFRIWRANIPRNTERRFNSTSRTEGNVSRDRMVSPWIKLKLSKDNPDTNKTIIHNIGVNYYN